MKRFLVSASVMAMLLAGFASRPVNAADDEVKGPVPTRSDANNPNTEVYRASDVMNMPVKNDDGAEVGRIKDLVINGESREVLYAVVSMNDAKEKDALYIMPWTVFQPYYGQGNALQYTVLTLPQSVWIQAPFYSVSQWRTVSYSQWAPRVNTYYSSHIRAGVNGTSGSTKVRASKPAINNDDVDSTPKSKTDRTDRKSDTDKKSDKPAPKADSDRDAPAPKTAPNPNPNPAPKATDKPDAPKAPATNPAAPGAPKTLPAPSPRDPKAPAPK